MRVAGSLFIVFKSAGSFYIHKRGCQFPSSPIAIHPSSKIQAQNKERDCDNGRAKQYRPHWKPSRLFCSSQIRLPLSCAFVE